MDDMLTDALRRILSDCSSPARVRAIEEGGSAEACWAMVEEAGFVDLGMSEEAGGGGLTLAELAPVALACGEVALQVPLMETIWARAVFPDLPSGPIALGLGVRSADGVAVSNVVLGRSAKWVAVQLAGSIRLLSIADAKVSGGNFGLDCGAVWPMAAWVSAKTLSDGGLDVRAIQAMLLSGQMAGAMLVVLRMSLDHANQRQQFGKPIGKFQAVQHQLSVMAEHVFAAHAAAEIAFDSGQGNHVPELMNVAIAKGRCSLAAVEVCNASHAIHGAIGFTQEFDLQIHTRRLHASRVAAGSESFWFQVAGAGAFKSSELSIWDLIRRASTRESKQ